MSLTLSQFLNSGPPSFQYKVLPHIRCTATGLLAIHMYSCSPPSFHSAELHKIRHPERPSPSYSPTQQLFSHPRDT